MNRIRNYFRRKAEERKERRFRFVVDNAALLFQVQEYSGELWLTYNGSLVCPCEMLRDGAIESLGKIRGMYVKRIIGNGRGQERQER